MKLKSQNSKEYLSWKVKDKHQKLLAHTINKFNTEVIHKGNKYYRFEEINMQKNLKKKKKNKCKAPSTPKS